MTRAVSTMLEHTQRDGVVLPPRGPGPPPGRRQRPRRAPHALIRHGSARTMSSLSSVGGSARPGMDRPTPPGVKAGAVRSACRSVERAGVSHRLSTASAPEAPGPPWLTISEPLRSVCPAITTRTRIKGSLSPPGSSSPIGTSAAAAREGQVEVAARLGGDQLLDRLVAVGPLDRRPPPGRPGGAHPADDPSAAASENEVQAACPGPVPARGSSGRGPAGRARCGRMITSLGVVRPRRSRPAPEPGTGQPASTSARSKRTGLQLVVCAARAAHGRAASGGTDRYGEVDVPPSGRTRSPPPVPGAAGPRRGPSSRSTG